KPKANPRCCSAQPLPSQQRWLVPHQDPHFPISSCSASAWALCCSQSRSWTPRPSYISTRASSPAASSPSLHSSTGQSSLSASSDLPAPPNPSPRCCPAQRLPPPPRSDLPTSRVPHSSSSPH